MSRSALIRSLAVTVAAVAVTSVAGAQAAPTRPATGQPATQRHGEGHDGEHHAIPWKALDTYHTVMAASWHPAKDRNDLAPFRARAGELLAAARALTAEPVPAACGGPARAAQVEALLRASEAASQAAGTAGMADAQVKAALKTAHDRFHAVEEGCAAPKH